MTLAIGIDAGGSTLRAALVDPAGKVVRAVRHRLGGRAPESVLRQLERVVADLGSIDSDAPMAVGLAGFIRLETGVVALSPNLGWREVPFGSMLSDLFGRQVRLVNDLGATAIGEAACGAGRGASDLVCVFVGTGVGMGAVVGGHVLEGSDGLAAELGHVRVAPPDTGRRCGCGETGCLEAYTSGRHLPDLLAEKVAAGTPSRLLDEVDGDLTLLDAGRIEAAAMDGDAAAVELWGEVAEHLGRELGNLLTLFGPRVLVLGGGVLLAAPSLKAQVVERLRVYAGKPQLDEVDICDSELGEHAGLVGAGLLAHGIRR
ncbi:ROK family protein [Myxococcota bacterium]